MGTAKELSTVSATSSGQPARKFDSPEVKSSGIGTVAFASAHFLVALTLIKNLLWGEKPNTLRTDETDEVPETTSALPPANDRDPAQSEPPEVANSNTPESQDSGGSGSQPSARFIPTSGFPAEGFSPDPLGAAKASLYGSPLQLLSNPGNDNAPINTAGFGGSSQAALAATGGGSGGGGGGASSDANKTPSEKSESEPSAPKRAENRAPVITGNVVMSYLPANHAVLIGLSDLLRNASDPDGDTLKVAELSASSGSLVNKGNGTWEFTPEPNSYVDVTFTYVVSDGIANVAQAAILDAVVDPAGVPAGSDTESNGSSDSESEEAPYNVITVDDSNVTEVEFLPNYWAAVTHGTSSDDVIQGRTGNDVIYARQGDDIVHAGAGHDIVFGEEGDDTIFGEDGEDSLFGGDGDDTLVGGADTDMVDGGTGNDTIVATHDDGDDDIDGGEGSDTLDFSGVATSVMVDLTEGNSEGQHTGTDHFRNIENVKGSQSDDVIVMNAQANTIEAGHGDDVIQSRAREQSHNQDSNEGDGDDFVDGGDGNDLLDYSSSTASIIVDVNAGTASGSDIDHDQFRSIEDFKTGHGDDVVITDDQDNVVDTGAGNDVVKTSSYRSTDSEGTSDGKDHFHGGEGNDSLVMASAVKDLDVDMVAETARGEEIDEDTFSSFENITTGAGNDRVVIDSHDNEIDTGEGDDVIIASAMRAVGSNEPQSEPSPEPQPTSEAQPDSETEAASQLEPELASDGNDRIVGGAGNDTLVMAEATTDIVVNLVEGTAFGDEIGQDKLVEIENITTGSGNDQITADSNDNEICGGDGDDVMRTSRNTDNDGRDNDGDDYFDGQNDDDTLDLSSTHTANTVNLREGTASGQEIGHDRISNIENVIGGSANDVFIASSDTNDFFGGDGDDTFVFQRVGDSPADNGRWDRIRDFTAGDKIDLSNIDANEDKSGDQSFTLDLTPSNPNFPQQAAGTIRYAYETKDNGTEYTIIRAQTGDKDDDALQIILDGHIVLTESDFILNDHTAPN